MFDYLPGCLTVKKMFGMHDVYWRKMIIPILRKRDNLPQMNGIWVATSTTHDQDLKKYVSEFAPFAADGHEHQSNWLLIPDDAEDLEGAAIKVCQMISHGDSRIGKLTEKPPL